MRQCPYWSLLHRWEPFVLTLFYFLVRLLYLAVPLSMMLSFRRFLQLSFHEHRFHTILFPFLQIMTPLLGPGGHIYYLLQHCRSLRLVLLHQYTLNCWTCLISDVTLVNNPLEEVTHASLFVLLLFFQHPL